jgi:hypothetical protein
MILRAVQQCDAKTRASFDAIVVFLGTDDHKMLLRIRNNTSFHYDGKLAVKALEQIDTGHALLQRLTQDA